MSQNVGGIWVRERAGRKTVKPEDVARAIEAHFTKRGAQVDATSARDIEPLSVEEGKGRLGFAVLRAEGGWITVADSERYTADRSLAQHLAKTLGAEVFWYVLYGATDAGIARWFGSKAKAPASSYAGVEEGIVEIGFPNPFLYFDQLASSVGKKELKATRFVSLRGVRADSYDAGPEPRSREDAEAAAEAAAEARARKTKTKTTATTSRSGARSKTAAAAPRETVLDRTKRAPFAPIALAYKKQRAGRDSLVLGFSCAVPMGELGPSVSRVLDAYLALVPEGALRWALLGGNSTTPRRLKDASIARARAMLAPKTAAKTDYTHFWLASDDTWDGQPAAEEPDNPDFLFLCDGERSVKPEKMDWGWLRPTGWIEMRFPSDFLWQLGVDRFVDFAKEVTAMLPVESGSAAIALTWSPLQGMLSQEAPRIAAPILLERPGLDVADSHHSLGGKCRGAHWLTFLGKGLVKTLGGEKKLLADVPGVDHANAGSAIMLRAGEAPSPDPSPKDRKLLASVARAVAPVTVFDGASGVFSYRDDPERDEARYGYRHLGGKKPAP